MAGENDGIQKLLFAEKEAAKKVNEARKNKALKLRQAKQEAQKEIEMEKRSMEEQFRRKQDKIMGSKTDYEQKINENTDYRINQIVDQVSKNRDKAINRLVELVLNITPELHTNFRKQTKQTLEVYIYNIVASAHFKTEIDLKALARNMINAEERDTHIVFAMKKPLIPSIKIFKNGKAVFLGCKSIEGFKMAVAKLAKQLRRALNYPNLRYIHMIGNIVTLTKLPFSINIPKIMLENTGKFRSDTVNQNVRVHFYHKAALKAFATYKGAVIIYAKSLDVTYVILSELIQELIPYKIAKLL